MTNRRSGHVRLRFGCGEALNSRISASRTSAARGAGDDRSRESVRTAGRDKGSR